MEMEYFQKKFYGSKTLDLTSEGYGDIFEGDFTDICAELLLLVSKGGRVDPSSMHKRGARTLIGAGGIFSHSIFDPLKSYFWACFLQVQFWN